MIATEPSPSLQSHDVIEAYLADQRRLTAVDRFARARPAATTHALPAQARYYRGLIPLEDPGPGEQYAFEVNLDACSGCKSCVAACHSLNGLDDDEAWRDVGELFAPAWSGADRQFTQYVTTACHHCLEPACMHGCPVNAYEKDPVTGIVKHLDDQCIGCQYCTLKCPYDAPKYHKGKGIVRKCDMCSDRLASNEAPACVQACPTQAIRIRVVDRAEVRAEASARRFLPGAPEPDYTIPTTRFRTRRDLSGARPADEYRVHPEHAHLPLVVMLVLTQLSVGGFVVARLLDASAGPALGGALPRVHAALALGLGLLALASSTLHLGRPRYAFRAVIGLGHSWLSREIVAFGGFATLAAVYAAGLWLTPSRLEGWAGHVLSGAVVAAGLGGVFCSAMIYHDTRRALWRLDRTLPRFLGTALMLGIPSVLLAAVVAAAADPGLHLGEVIAAWGRPLGGALAAIGLAKLLFEAAVLCRLRDAEHTPMKRTAILMAGPLHQVTVVRFVVGVIGAVAIPLVLVITDPGVISPPALLIALSLVVALTFAGELLERYLFFAAVVRPKMPGGVGS